VIKITVEQDGQTLDEFVCNQFYLLVADDDKVTERVLCKMSFLINIAMRIYGYALKAVEEVVNKMTKEEEVVVNKAAEEILN